MTYINYINMSLEVKNLTFSFDESHLFKDLNFHLKKNGVSLISVSYTHLRAHETVLDLVCRLLLEKKKIYVTTNSGCNSYSLFSSLH